MKTTRIDAGQYGFQDGFGHGGSYKVSYNTSVELATELFGKPGTQAGRRWFYRMQFLNKDWRRVGRKSELKILLYFRNTADAVFFSLKNSG
jgi:hypothetical protein